MQTDCWPVNLAADWDQVVITGTQNRYWAQQQGTLRAWLSINPNGINILPVQNFRNRDVHLGALGNTWCFYRQDLAKQFIQPAQISFPVNPTQLGDGDIPAYWFMIQNLDGMENAYYLQFAFHGRGGVYIT
jgi:hypothetical protein